MLIMQKTCTLRPLHNTYFLFKKLNLPVFDNVLNIVNTKKNSCYHKISKAKTRKQLQFKIKLARHEKFTLLQ